MELNREVLDCMKNLRRRVRDELAVDIRLSQPDVVSAMLIACLRCNDPHTRALGLRLAQLSDTQLPEDPTAVAPEPHSPSPSGSIRVYRGQRIYA